jgi:UDP-2,4-diacetamido-2,4,6-trideoxy-beta-L-altropyranose hydrolase
VTRHVVLRADASVAIGTGHVMRCLTLAEEMIARGWAVTLFSAELPGPLEQRVAACGIAISSSDAFFAAIATADAVILDSYALDVSYRARVHAAGRPVLTLDDGPTLPSLCADLVLNPSRAARAADYADTAPGATLLLGPRFALVRNEIRIAARQALDDAAERKRLLVLFGGSDPLQLTGSVAAALHARLPEARITAVLGGAANAASLPGSVECLRDPPNLPALMADSGLAVSAAGGTLGELAVCGVPTVAAMVADNQGGAVATMPGWGVAIDARAADAVDALADAAEQLWRDPAARRRMGEAARRDVDGDGAIRVIDALAQHFV